MGQAKRRKMAGNYPDSTDSLAVARRFWARRDPVAPEDFVAPTGTVAITIDVEGTAPSTCMFDAAKVTDLTARANELAGGLSYHSAVRYAAKTFVEARKSRDDTKLTGVGIVILWTALHHPQQGELMRQRVSASLRQTGKAHLTWHFGRNGLGLVLADRFVDLEPIAALAPKDRLYTYAAPGVAENPDA